MFHAYVRVVVKKVATKRTMCIRRDGLGKVGGPGSCTGEREPGEGWAFGVEGIT
jgi:hypothetical protein